MDFNDVDVYPARNMPPGCWLHVFEHLDPPALARAASVNRTWRTASYDDRLWLPHFEQAWSPECCDSVEPKGGGKEYHTMYARWLTGKPGHIDLIPGVHGSEVPGGLSVGRRVNALQLSTAGALAAWSVGEDGALVSTDVTTCQTRSRFPAAHGAGAQCLTVLDSIGLICTGGSDRFLRGWDPRQEGNGSPVAPVFNVDCLEAGGHSDEVYAMISAGSPEGDGSTQLVTGGADEMIYRWDLRYIDGGPVQEYEGHGGTVYSLATEPQHGTLLSGGGDHVINCWDLGTGAWLSTHMGHQGDVYALVVGNDRLVSGGDDGKVLEWALPNPQAIQEEAEPLASLTLAHTEEYRRTTQITCMQGLGNGPAGVLAGTWDGPICLLERLNKPLPLGCSLEDRPHTYVPVTCLAATDEVVVNGFYNGALRMMRMNTPFGHTSETI